MSPRLQTPSYLLRRRLVLRLLDRAAPTRVLEIGCGRGELLARLAARGWTAVGLEISATAAATARETTRPYASQVQIVDNPEEVRGKFEYVLALEVLEHIEDDVSALQEWRAWVQPGGSLVLTVPAHESKWTASDEYGGHFRRYERARLQEILARAGFELETFWSFGFPLTAITIPLRRIGYRRRLKAVQTLSRKERTLQSAFDSTRELPALPIATLGVEAFTLVFHWLQLPFLKTDLGASYLVSCRRPQA